MTSYLLIHNDLSFWLGQGLLASRACRSKYLQRWYVAELAPRSMALPAARRLRGVKDGHLDPALRCEFEAIGFPTVVKPASRHSSWGVLSVDDLAELCGENSPAIQNTRSRSSKNAWRARNTRSRA